MTSPARIESPAASAATTWPGPLLALGLYLVTKPFYFFPSGGPQLADAVIPCLVAWLLFRGTPAPSPRSVGALFWGTCFVLWAGCVNVFYAVWLADASMLKMPVFLLFNLAVFAICLLLADRYGDRFFRCVLIASAAALFLQAFLSLFVQSPTRRQILFFNNPNQLGYWSLLAASIFFLCAERIRVQPLLKAAVAAVSFYLVALSLSKAAILSAVVLYALVYGLRLRQLAVGLGLVILGLIAMQGTDLYENLAWRLGNIGAQGDDNLAIRGYAWLWEFPEYLVLGAGQGAYERFRGWRMGIEFHSTLGSLLFSYGIVGLGLFGAFLWKILQSAGPYRFSFLVPAFLYGVTHQGLRFSVFWALFAMVASIGFASSRGAQSR